MPDVTAILDHKAFWRYYTRVTEEPLKGRVLKYFDKVVGNDDEDEGYENLVITLPCGPMQSLSLSVCPEAYSIELGLKVNRRESSMGWWDDVRWHPFAIRWEELLSLHRYWEALKDNPVHPNAAFLLLAVFVGHGVDEQESLDDRKSVLRDHFAQLELFSKAECKKLAERSLILPAEKDYTWTRDGKLGWIFGGGEYPCYSLRNREHAGGEEGKFPFSAWKTVVRGLPKMG